MALLPNICLKEKDMRAKLSLKTYTSLFLSVVMLIQVMFMTPFASAEADETELNVNVFNQSFAGIGVDDGDTASLSDSAKSRLNKNFAFYYNHADNSAEAYKSVSIEDYYNSCGGTTLRRYPSLLPGTWFSTNEPYQHIASLVPKDGNGEIATLKNFEATFTVKFDMYAGGGNRVATDTGVYFGFRQDVPGLFALKWNPKDNLNPNQGSVFIKAGGDIELYDGNTLKDTKKVTSYSSYGQRQNVVVKIRLVGDQLTFWVNDEKIFDNVTLDKTPSSAGYMAWGAGYNIHGFKSISITRLDDEGKEINFSLEEFNQSFANIGVTAEDKSELSGLAKTELNDNFAAYYNHADNTVDSYKAVRIDDYYNSCGGTTLRRYPSLLPGTWFSENEPYQHIASLVPKDKNGELAVLKNFETTFSVKFDMYAGGGERNATNTGIYFGFRQDDPGEFALVWNPLENLNPNQGSIFIKAGGDIELYDGSELKESSSVTSYNTYAKRQKVLITVRLVGQKISLWINGEEVFSEVVLENTPNAAGYMAWGAGYNIHGFNSIGITRLDENGRPVDFTENSSIIPWETEAEALEYDFSTSEIFNNALSEIEFYFADKGIENKDAHWLYDTESEAVKRVNDLENTDRHTNMSVIKLKNYKLSDFQLTANVNFYNANNTEATFWIGLHQTDGTYKVVNTNGTIDYSNSQASIGISRNKIIFASGNGTATEITEENTISPGENVIRIRVLDRTCQVWVNGLLAYTSEVDKNIPTEGTVSLGVAGDVIGIAGFGLEKIDKYGETVNINSNVKSVEAVSDKSVPLGTDFQDIGLPQTLEITYNDNTKLQSEVYWVSKEYNPLEENVYKCIGYLKNSNALRVYVMVTVTQPYDSSVITKYYFSSADELDDFESYYIADTLTNSEAVADTEKEHWKIYDGGLYFKDTAIYKDKTSNTAVLMLKTKKYTNFELTLKYTANDTDWQMVGFGAAANDLNSVFFNQENGGNVVYVEKGTITDTGSAVLKADNDSYISEKSFYRDYKPMVGVHTLHLVVNDGVLKLYLDDNKTPFVEKLSDYNGGYIYLASNQSEASFQSLAITDYGAKEINITALSLEDISIDRIAGEYLQLPECVTAITNEGYEYKCYPEWITENYDSQNGGNFSIKLPDCFKIAKDVKSNILVTNKNLDYNPTTTRKYYFDSISELDDFYSYYSENTYVSGNNTMTETPAEENWAIVNGKLQRLNRNFAYTPDSNETYYKYIAELVLKDINLDYYELSIDYTQGADTYQWAMVSVGKTDPSQFVYKVKDGYDYINDDAGVYCYTEKEGRKVFWGSVQLNSYVRGGIRHRTALPDNFGMTAQHNMKLRVMGNIVYISVDGGEAVAIEMTHGCIGGLMGLVSGRNTSVFDNLSITALDQDGCPITFKQAMKEQKKYSGWNPTDTSFSFK